MNDPASFTGTTGAGLYGAPPPTHKTACPNSNNPFGHSAECPCRRASQSVPYAESSELHRFFGYADGTGGDPLGAA